MAAYLTVVAIYALHPSSPDLLKVTSRSQSRQVPANWTDGFLNIQLETSYEPDSGPLSTYLELV